jgi:hypothetical protein
MREALDRFVKDVHDDARDKGPSKTSDEWFGAFTEFLAEGGVEEAEPASVLDLFDMVTGGDEEEDEET